MRGVVRESCGSVQGEDRLVPSVIDCFVFYNELDMLAYRLNVLEEHVDWFVLVEATRSFAGNEKLLHYKEQKYSPRFHRFREKIIHIVVDDAPDGTSWDREWHQRNCIDRGLWLLQTGLSADDLILISDVDEIPDPAVIRQLRTKQHDTRRAYTLLQHFYYWDVEHLVSEECAAAKAVRWDAYQHTFGRKPQLVREDREHLVEQIPRAGWHLSYFGDDRFVSNKIRNFAHQELNLPEHTDEATLAARRAAGQDVFGYPTPVLKQIPIAENPYPPPRLDLLPHQKLP